MKNFYQNLPETPGVYIFKNSAGKILYIGKAGNLKRRVSSYFLRPHDFRIEKMVREIRKIDYEKTGSALEALILEANLIKKKQPSYNVLEKDDTSFLHVEITAEKFPRVLLVRGRSARKKEQRRYGPFVSPASVREALRILRKIFPWNLHSPEKVGKFSRPCFDYELGLCPGTCIGAISREEYAKTIRALKLFLDGRKRRLIALLEREMRAASRRTDFEKAQICKKQIFGLQHIQDVALIGDERTGNSSSKLGISAKRIEGYDISNISGTSAVGSMVVFKDAKSVKSEYRKFRIRTIQQQNDVGMIKEILRRRFTNSWMLPDLILVDGGKGQVNVAKSVLEEIGLAVPVVGLAKGPERKKNEFLGVIPEWVERKTLIEVRDEAHRFAISYHRRIRGRASLN